MLLSSSIYNHYHNVRLTNIIRTFYKGIGGCFKSKNGSMATNKRIAHQFTQEVLYLISPLNLNKIRIVTWIGNALYINVFYNSSPHYFPHFLPKRQLSLIPYILNDPTFRSKLISIFHFLNSSKKSKQVNDLFLLFILLVDPSFFIADPTYEHNKKRRLNLVAFQDIL